MQLVSDRSFRFPFDPDAAWDALDGTGEYQRWWPWLREFDATGLVLGDRWRCAVRPPLPYTLRFTIELTEVTRPTTLAAVVYGDIAGGARVEIAPDGDAGSRIRLRSTLAPGNRAFGMVATMARPIVTRGHDWILDRGAAQFAAAGLVTPTR